MNIPYAIESNDGTYTMKLTPDEAKMSNHVTQLIKLDGSSEIRHFGQIDIDGKTLEIIDKYIKRFARSTEELTDKICPYHLINSEKEILNSSANVSSLARGAMYLDIKTLVHSVTKFYANAIMDTTDNLNIREFDKLYALFGITQPTTTCSDNWKKTDEYKNFMSNLFVKKYVCDTNLNMKLGKKQQLLADIMSLTQQNPDCPMYHLGAYFNGIMNLLYFMPFKIIKPAIDRADTLDGADGTNETEWTDEMGGPDKVKLNKNRIRVEINVECDDLLLELLCQYFDDDEIINVEQITINCEKAINHNDLTRIPAEIIRFANLKNLQLSYSGIKKLPIELGCLPNIKIIDVSGTKITNIHEKLIPLYKKGILIISHTICEYKIGHLIIDGTKYSDPAASQLFTSLNPGRIAHH